MVRRRFSPKILGVLVAAVVLGYCPTGGFAFGIFGPRLPKGGPIQGQDVAPTTRLRSKDVPDELIYDPASVMDVEDDGEINAMQWEAPGPDAGDAGGSDVGSGVTGTTTTSSGGKWVTCSVLVLSNVILPNDSSKADKIKRELGIAFSTAADAAKGDVCFGMISDGASDFSGDDKSRFFNKKTASLIDRFFTYDDLFEGRYSAFARCIAYGRVLREVASWPIDEQKHVIFVDTDLLFMDNIAKFYKSGGPGHDPFDVALTYRDMPKFPINTGLIFFHKQRLEQGASFMEATVQEYDKQGYEKESLGDQYVMAVRTMK